MNNNTTMQDYSPTPSLDFCQSRETYVQWVADWKAAYRDLSLRIRQSELSLRAAYSEAARPGNAHATLLRAQAEIIKLPPAPPWLARNQNAISWSNPWVTPSGRKTYSWTALASWMCQLRRDAKVAANAAWLAAREKSCQEKVSPQQASV